ncbi:MAG: hypothetical protein ACKVHR_15680 [Pirellulales bacterium]|jgi:hypothetical protein
MGLIFGRTDAAKNMWKTAKKNFEKKTGKKKPSKKFLGAFRKSSGLESAIDAVDQLQLAVWDARTQKEFDKSKATFLKVYAILNKKADQYVKVLEASAEGDYKEFKPEVLELQSKLKSGVKSLLNNLRNRNDFE